MTSKKEVPAGLKAMNVINLNMLNIARKMIRRFITHKMVLGILYFTSINFSDGFSQKVYKRIEFKPFQQLTKFQIINPKFQS